MNEMPQSQAYAARHRRRKPRHMAPSYRRGLLTWAAAYAAMIVTAGYVWSATRV